MGEAACSLSGALAVDSMEHVHEDPAADDEDAPVGAHVAIADPQPNGIYSTSQPVAAGASDVPVHEAASTEERAAHAVVDSKGADAEEDKRLQQAQRTADKGKGKARMPERRRSSRGSDKLGLEVGAPLLAGRKCLSQHFQVAQHSSMREEHPPEQACACAQACPICMDAQLEVAVSGCSHALCGRCAYQLCARGLAAPVCPFCRGPIQRFELFLAH